MPLRNELETGERAKAAMPPREILGVEPNALEPRFQFFKNLFEYFCSKSERARTLSQRLGYDFPLENGARFLLFPDLWLDEQARFTSAELRTTYRKLSIKFDTQRSFGEF